MEVRVPGYAPLNGIHDHIHAVLGGDAVEDRLNIIAGSNELTEEARRVQSHFLRAFCLFAALESLEERTIDLGDGYTFHLGRRREEVLHEGDLPGVRVDGNGWLVLEGQFYHNGKSGLRFDEKGYPLWPFMVLNPPVSGRGPWENFRGQAFQLLRVGAEGWPYGD